MNAAINKITEEKINTHVNVNYVALGDFISQVQFSISGGEQIDVLCLCVTSGVTTMHSNGMLMDVTELAQEYAPETLALLGNLTDTYKYDGKLYGFHTYRNFLSNGYVVMKKAILDELSLTEKAQNLSSWSEYEEILAAVHEKVNGTGEYAVLGNLGNILGGTGIMLHGDKFADIEVYDAVSDNTGTIYVNSQNQAVLHQAEEGYEWGLSKVREWFDKGYVYPDSLYTDVDGDTLISQGVGFSQTLSCEYGVEVTKQGIYGFEVICAQYYTGNVKTSNLTGWGVGIPTTAEEPEAAMKFINELYTNPDIMNLLMRGEEGTDYELVDGQAAPIEGMYNGVDFIGGNNCLLYPSPAMGRISMSRSRTSTALRPRAPIWASR